MEENDKNFLWSLAESERERKSFEKMFKQVKIEFFLKLDSRCSIDRKKQVQSIEPDRGSLKFLTRISIDRKTQWINRKSGKNSFLKKKKN